MPNMKTTSSPLTYTMQHALPPHSTFNLVRPGAPRRLSPPLRATGPPAESALPPQALAPLVAGKKFLCTECGKCCTGAGEVWANSAEVTALARSKGLSEKHFISKYTKSYSRRPGWFLLQRKQGSGHCIFLHKDGKQCTVYGARPMQCTTVRIHISQIIIISRCYASFLTKKVRLPNEIALPLTTLTKRTIHCSFLYSPYTNFNTIPFYFLCFVVSLLARVDGRCCMVSRGHGCL